MKLQRKVYVANISLRYFMMNCWNFYNENSLGLLNRLSAEDKIDFGFNYHEFDIYKFLKYVLGSTNKFIEFYKREKERKRVIESKRVTVKLNVTPFFCLQNISKGR